MSLPTSISEWNQMLYEDEILDRVRDLDNCEKMRMVWNFCEDAYYTFGECVENGEDITDDLNEYVIENGLYEREY